MACLFLICFCELDYTLSAVLPCIAELSSVWHRYFYKMKASETGLASFLWTSANACHFKNPAIEMTMGSCFLKWKAVILSGTTIVYQL